MKNTNELKDILQKTEQELVWAKEELQQCIEEDGLEDLLYISRKVIQVTTKVEMLKKVVNGKHWTEQYLIKTREREISSLLNSGLNETDEIKTKATIEAIKIMLG